MSLPSRGYAYVRRWIRILLPVRQTALRDDEYGPNDYDFGIGEGKTAKTRPCGHQWAYWRLDHPCWCEDD